MEKMNLNLLLILLISVLSFTACDKEEDSSLIPDFNEAELIVKDRNGSVESIFNEIAAAVNNKGLMTIATINHSAIADSLNISIRPTRTIIFGNPATGTQLMQSDQRIGIDLPLKFVVWEDDDGDTKVAYYNATTLTQRYSINDKADVVKMIDETMEELSGGEAAEAPDAVDNITDKLIVKQSPMTAAQTYTKLISAIEADSALSITAKVEHDIAAQNANLVLRPTKLVIFGNPAVGSKFIETDQRIGIDLPLKILVWENASGETWVGYYNATTLKDRYDILSRDDEEQQINNLLDQLTDTAVTP